MIFSGTIRETLITLEMKVCIGRQWILKATLIFLVASCFAKEIKGAVPDPPVLVTEDKGSNSTSTMDEKFKDFWKKQNGGLCGYGQVPQRNHTVCCFVTACGPGFEIEECLSNGTTDTCTKCKENYLQLNNISSLNMEEAKCFPIVKDHQQCPIGDMRKARKIMHEEHFPLPCECKQDECYIGDDQGWCTLKDKCDSGSELHRNGTCESCPWYSYKNISGCEPCTINITLLRQGKPGRNFIPPDLRTTTVTDEKTNFEVNQSTDEVKSRDPDNKGHRLETTNIILIIISGIIAVLLVVLLVVCIWKRKNKSDRSGPGLQTPTLDNAPLLQGQGMTTPTPTDGTGIGNANQPSNLNPLVVQKGNGYMNGYGHTYILNNIGNGIATNGCDGLGHYIDNLKDSENAVNANGSLPGQISDRALPVTDMNERVIQPPSELHVVDEHYTHEGNVPPKEMREQRERKRKADVDNLDEGENIGRQVLASNAEHSLQVGSGGESTYSDDVENSLVSKKNKPRNFKASEKTKIVTSVSFHGNKFKDCKIIIGGSKAKVHSGNSEQLTGSFEMDNSINSDDSRHISSDSTLLQTGRGDGIQREDKVDDVSDSSLENTLCRPELRDYSGSSNADRNLQQLTEEEDNSREDLSEGAKRTLAVEKCGESLKEGEQAASERPPVGDAVLPFQRSTSRERPMAKVLPTFRQNSGIEVRHVSGYPSRMADEESASSLGSVSYVFLHHDTNLDNGNIIRDIANADDISEIDGRDSHQSTVSDDVLRNPRGSACDGGVQQEVVGSVGEHAHSSAMHSDFSTAQQTRREVNRNEVTISIPPMSQRQEPEGNSVTYTPENGHFIPRPDLQHTYRKMYADEEDGNQTYRKQEGSNSTAVKTVDEDLTETKRIKVPIIENSTDMKKHDSIDDLKKAIELKGASLNTGESFELKSEDVENAFNVENIVYEDDRTEDGEMSASKECGNDVEETSFEISSSDVKKVPTANVSPEENINCDSVKSDDNSKSFEIDSEDIQQIRQDLSEYDVTERQDRKETNSSSCEQSENNKELVTEEPISNRDHTMTCDGEASFEINTSEIQDLNLIRGRDVSSGADQRYAKEKPDTYINDTQYVSVTSADELADCNRENE